MRERGSAEEKKNDLLSQIGEPVCLPPVVWSALIAQGLIHGLPRTKKPRKGSARQVARPDLTAHHLQLSWQTWGAFA